MSEQRVSDDELNRCAFEDRFGMNENTYRFEWRADGLVNRLALDLRDARAENAKLRAKIERLEAWISNERRGKIFNDYNEGFDDALCYVKDLLTDDSAHDEERADGAKCSACGHNTHVRNCLAASQSAICRDYCWCEQGDDDAK